MADEGFKRKLAAILSADVIGYSRLMRDDEEATVRDIAAHRVLITEIIQQHNGRVVDSPGDNILAEFASVVDAVNGAIKIQKEIDRSNTNTPANRRMEFRIGINLGDVIEEEERIYGDGVNIAARVEGLAAGGGIAISGIVYDSIKDKLSLGYHYLGEQEVKNIPEPVRIYRLLTEPADAGKMIGEKKSKSRKWIWVASGAAALIIFLVGGLAIWNFHFRPSFEPASVEKMAFPLPEKPSIAVLPFDNLSGDPEQEFFIDGLAENIITQLSLIHQLFVISRESTFTYKGKDVEVRQVAEELGVRYILEGSVQGSKDRVRVTAQLIDAINGRHLWADRYDREINEIFTIQDEITYKVVTEIAGELSEGELSRLMIQKSPNFKAYGYYIKAQAQFRKHTNESNLIARELAEKAIEIDPQYSLAYSMIAWTHAFEIRLGTSKNPTQTYKQIDHFVNKALESDPENKDVPNLLTYVHILKRQYDQAIIQGRKAVQLAPSVSDAHALLALSLLYAGQAEEAIEEITKAMRLARYYPAYFLYCIGQSYFLTGRYEEAIIAFKEGIERNPEWIDGYLWLAVIYSAMGHDKQAQIEVKEALKRKPTLSLEKWRGTLQYKDEVVIDQIIAYARKAGLPEHPPLKLPDKPSIAVLPFANMSGDPEQEWFSDGFTDELIGDLAKISDILVISRNSAFTYKGKQIKIAQIAKELNVRYVLEGSVQKSGDKVRIRAQLIDGKTDHHLWAESYDGVLNDIFDLQDKITGKIVSALAVQLSPSEQKRVAEKGTDNVLAYEVFLKGGAHFVKHTPKDLLQAIEYYKQAIKFDPNFGRAYAALGYTYLIGGNQGWSKKMGSDWGTMRLLARHYLEEAMKNPSPEAYALAGVLEIHTRNFQKSITFAEKAYNYAPNSADRMTGLAWILAFADRTEESIELLNKEMRIADPFGVKGTTAMSYIWIGVNHFSMENLEEAITNLEKGLSLNPKATNFSCFLAASHALLGHDIEAKKALAEYLKGRRHPPPIQSLYYSWPFKDSKVFDRFAQGLVKAGLRGDPKKYYKLNKENKLAGQEIRKLLFGNTFSGYVYGIKELKYSYDIRDDGELEYSYKGQTYTGKTWMEGDKICVLRENYYGGLKDCREIYRNPEGDELTKTEYFNVTDYGFFLFSVEK